MSKWISSPAQSVQRVLQLDADRLDEELRSLFHTSLTSLLRHLPGRSPDSAVYLKLFLRFLNHFNTVDINEPTPGNALQRLRYESVTGASMTRWQRNVHLLLDTIVPFVLARLRMIFRHPVIASLMTPLTALYAMCVLANRVHFLRTGKYPTLTHRAAGTRIAYDGHPVTPRTAFQLVDRQLVWQGLAELALCVAPIVRQFFASRFARHGMLTRRSTVGTTASIVAARAHSLICPVCQTSPSMPHLILPCQCVSCYVCLHRDTVSCPSCGSAVAAIERMQYS